MKRFEIQSDADLEAAIERLSAQGDGGADAERRGQKQFEDTHAVVEAVRTGGDVAVAAFTERFDRVTLRPDQFELTKDEVDAAVRQVEPALVAALQRAHENIRRFHEKNLRHSWEEVSEDGTTLGQRITPIESAGVYVPGAKAFYPSSVLMNIVPARVAGVRDIIMVSPPSYEGSIHPLMLAAARIAGATRIFRIGGAQAVAALAYGTKHVPSVLKIAGPGNIYVTLAKRIVSTVCDIDKEAGPSEVVVIADEQANPRWVAIELLAQAEHDEEACATLVTTSDEMADRVLAEMGQLTSTLSRSAIIQEALDGHGVVYVVRNLRDAARLTDAIAPEHLSIQVEVPRKVLDEVRNVGAAILGPMTPVAVGDYYAGPNHILPTGRRARFASPLTAEDFRKVTSIISFSKQRLIEAADDIRMLAEAEQLTAHARAVELRL